MTSIPANFSMRATTEELEALASMPLMSFSEGPSTEPLHGEIDALRKIDDSLALGGERLREALCSVPFYAEGERKAMERGGLREVARYWKGLFGNEINLHRPPKETASSTADH